MEITRTVRRIPTQTNSCLLLTDRTAYTDVRDLTSREQINSNTYVGKWFTFLSMNDPDDKKRTTLDKAWFKVLDAYEDDKSIFREIMVSTSMKQSTCIVPPKVQAIKKGVVMCFTNDFRDTLDVRRAGFIFRKILKKEVAGRDIYYMRGFTEYCGINRCRKVCSAENLLYLQIPCGFYLLRSGSGNENKHKPLKIKKGRNRLIPTMVTDVEWLTGQTAYSEVNEAGRSKPGTNDTTDATDLFLPYYQQTSLPETTSDVSTEDMSAEEESLYNLICAFERALARTNKRTNNSEESKIFSTVGKWMAFLPNNDRGSDGLTTLDKAWFKVLDAWEKEYEIFSTIMVTTSLEEEFCVSPANNRESQGAILCFTNDYRHLKDVRRAAIVLRQILAEELYGIKIYYKTDNATYAFQYKCLGSIGVSMYRHSPDGSFWKRIGNYKWEQQIMGKTTMLRRIPSNVSHITFFGQDLAMAPVEEEFVYSESHEENPEDVVLQRWVEESFPREREKDAGNYLIENRFTGYWKAYLSLDKKDEHGLTHLDQGWYRVLEHQGRDPTKFCSILVSTKRLVIPFEGERFGIVCCSTKDYRDMPDVRRAAEHLRDVLRDLVVNDKLYYHAKGFHMYKHDPDWSFWEQMDDESWQRRFVEVHPITSIF